MFDPLSTETIQGRRPDAVAEIRLYGPEEGGSDAPILPGYGCVGVIRRKPRQEGFFVWFLIDKPLPRGETHKVGLCFFTPEGMEAAKDLGSFPLWEGRVIGEAKIAALN
jgi:hypothetical protein